MTKQQGLAVDPGAVQARGHSLRNSAETAENISRGVQAAMSRLGQVGCVASLSLASVQAAQTWGQGVGQLSHRGRALGLATQASAQAYRSVEDVNESRFKAPVGGN